MGQPRRSSRVPATLGVCAAVALASSARAEEVVRVAGSGPALGMLARLRAAFERTQPGAVLVIAPSLGNAGDTRALAGGALDVGWSARPLNDEERALGLRDAPIARTSATASAPQGAATSLLPSLPPGRELADSRPASTIYVVISPSPRHATRRFLAFLTSGDVRRILREAGAQPIPFTPPG